MARSLPRGFHRLGGAVGAVDVLAPQHVVDAEFGGASQQEVADPVAERDALTAGRITGDEDVERQALVVLVQRVGPEPTDLFDLRERLETA